MKFLIPSFVFLFIFTSCNNTQINTSENEIQYEYLAQKKENGFPTVGNQIQVAREKKGLSYDQLAKATGLTDKNIQSIEKNKVVPTRDMLVSIQQILDAEIILDAY